MILRPNNLPDYDANNDADAVIRSVLSIEMEEIVKAASALRVEEHTNELGNHFRLRRKHGKAAQIAEAAVLINEAVLMNEQEPGKLVV
jgi:hypothetical protein